ncbi:hypothetical protein HanIR_Chr10g0455701 [Helianthus annuus]|nr:hypothetical protein HanIR_Chr10g0455701 [Helianthus annuus]
MLSCHFVKNRVAGKQLSGNCAVKPRYRKLFLQTFHINVQNWKRPLKLIHSCYDYMTLRLTDGLTFESSVGQTRFQLSNC